MDFIMNKVEFINLVLDKSLIYIKSNALYNIYTQEPQEF